MNGATVYFWFGFFAASLCALMVMPLVYARAARLASRTPATPLPVSTAEIKADKDQLRAELTMSLRGLQGKVKQLGLGTAQRLQELDAKDGMIDRLKAALNEKTAAVDALEARSRVLRDRLNATEEELSNSDNALREARRTLADKELQLAWITTHFRKPSVLADRLRFGRGHVGECAASGTEIGLETLQSAPPTAPAGDLIDRTKHRP